jgi:hypothetical protein
MAALQIHRARIISCRRRTGCGQQAMLEIIVLALGDAFLSDLECELQNFSAYGNADNEKDQAHHEEEKEQEFCNSRSSRRDAGKSE